MGKQIKKRLLRINAKNKISYVENFQERNKNIFRKILLNKIFKSSTVIFCYFSVGNEVDTKEIIRYSLDNGKRVFIPFINEIKVGEIKSLNDLKVASSGFYEPSIQSILPNERIFGIIPGLAFTKDGKRLGRGTGWYDKFLKDKENIFKVGICYVEQLVIDLPTSEWDVTMDEVMVI